MHELARHVRDRLELDEARGIGLDEILWRRIRRLPDEPRGLLEAVAVAGRPLRLRHARDAAGLGALPPRMIARLRAEHLLRGTGPGLDDFIETYHDRVRESLLARLPAEDVRDRHGRLAEALEAAGDADPEQLATHFLAAGRPGRRPLLRPRRRPGRPVLAFDRAEELYRTAIRLAGSDDERAEVYERMIHFMTDQARFAEAYDIGREAVGRFGVKLPARFIPPLFAIDLVQARWRLLFRTTAAILAAPTLNDIRLTTAIRLMAAVGKAAYQVRPELCIAVLVKMVNLCLRFGNTPDCAIGFMAFGSIFLGGVLGDHPKGYDFGRLVLELIEKYGNERQRAEVLFVVGYFGTSWVRPATEAEALWRAAYDAGIRSGDLFHTGLRLCRHGGQSPSAGSADGSGLGRIRAASPVSSPVAAPRAARHAGGDPPDDPQPPRPDHGPQIAGRSRVRRGGPRPRAGRLRLAAPRPHLLPVQDAGSLSLGRVRRGGDSLGSLVGVSEGLRRGCSIRPNIISTTR